MSGMALATGFSRSKPAASAVPLTNESRRPVATQGDDRHGGESQGESGEAHLVASSTFQLYSTFPFLPPFESYSV